MSVTVACYYFGNYHPGDSRNVRQKGPGWSEWEVVKAARPRFPGRLRHDGGLVQHAAIGQGRDGGDDMQRRDRDAVAEGDGHGVDVAPAVGARRRRGAAARHRDAAAPGPGGEAFRLP